MGLIKNRHGTYYAQKMVPARLQDAVAQVLGNGKAKQVWLKKSLGTKVVGEANVRAKPVQMHFDRIIADAEALLKARPLRTSLSAVEIRRIAEYYYADRLASHDEFLRIAPDEERARRELEPGETWADDVPAFGLSRGQVADANVTIPEVLHDAEVALAQGNIGHIAIQIDDVLSAFSLQPRPSLRSLSRTWACAAACARQGHPSHAATTCRRADRDASSAANRRGSSPKGRDIECCP